MKQFDFESMPIVEIVNEIIMDAVNKNASDIHLDPTKENLRLRIRIDGELSDYGIIEKKYQKNIISRIKMISGMNIMETRLPQDGAIKNKIGDNVLDLRVSSLPTNNGEKIVIRILDYSQSLKGLETLGFSQKSLDKIYKMINVPNGIILVTGATGTGKSTTVYSILQKLNTENVNIITVEDPIEMDIKGINQVQTMSEIGLTFETVLRSILRQDPNIVMIGEIRDSETARMAVRASITGHLVLSTIHTNNSLNTIERLTDMEIERYLLGSALTGIISQRLARKLCPKCAIKKPTNEYEKNVFRKVLGVEVNEMLHPNPEGCPECSHGYRGRVAILEVLRISEEIKDAIVNSLPKSELRKLVYNGDVITLLQDGLEKVIEGITSFEEILKIIDLENDLTSYQDFNLKTNLDVSTINNKNDDNSSNNQVLVPNQDTSNVINNVTTTPEPEVIAPIESTPIMPIVTENQTPNQVISQPNIDDVVQIVDEPVNQQTDSIEVFS